MLFLGWESEGPGGAGTWAAGRGWGQAQVTRDEAGQGSSAGDSGPVPREALEGKQPHVAWGTCVIWRRRPHGGRGGSARWLDAVSPSGSGSRPPAGRHVSRVKVLRSV